MRLLCFAMLSLCFISAAAAQSSAATQTLPAPATPSMATPVVVDMDVVVVSGMQPGPGMWRVSKGDHVLWVMGTLSPAPKKMTWISRDVEATIAASQLVLKSPGASVDSDIGVFRSALLIPSLFKARKNPNGATLKDVLPPDLSGARRITYLPIAQMAEEASLRAERGAFEALMDFLAARLERRGLSVFVRAPRGRHRLRSLPPREL